MTAISPNTRSLPFVPPLQVPPVAERKEPSKFSDSSEGIRLWSKISLSWKDCFFARIEDPGVCANFEAASDEWVEKNLEQVLRTRAVWNSRMVFKSTHPDVFTREFWQNCPLRREEFAKALALYYEEESAKHGAFGLGQHDLFPASYMTPSQQMSYIRLLARKNPSVLAEHIRSWVCSKEQIQEVVSLLFKKSPHDLLLLGNSIEDVWSDGKKHPELVEFLQSEERNVLARMIQKDPKILQFLKSHIERLGITLTQEERDQHFLFAGMHNPASFMAYKDVLSPSPLIEKKVYVYIFEKGPPGAVELFQSLKTRFSVEDEYLYLELLIRSCPDQVLTHLRRSLTKVQLAKAFKNAVFKKPSICGVFHEMFLRNLSSKQRAEVLDIVLTKDPKELKGILDKVSDDALDGLLNRASGDALKKLLSGLSTKDLKALLNRVLDGNVSLSLADASDEELKNLLRRASDKELRNLLRGASEEDLTLILAKVSDEEWKKLGLEGERSTLKEIFEYRELENYVMWRLFCINVNLLIAYPAQFVENLKKGYEVAAKDLEQSKKGFLERWGFVKADLDDDF